MTRRRRTLDGKRKGKVSARLACVASSTLRLYPALIRGSRKTRPSRNSTVDIPSTWLWTGTPPAPTWRLPQQVASSVHEFVAHPTSSKLRHFQPRRSQPRLTPGCGRKHGAEIARGHRRLANLSAREPRASWMYPDSVGDTVGLCPSKHRDRLCGTALSAQRLGAPWRAGWHCHRWQPTNHQAIISGDAESRPRNSGLSSEPIRIRKGQYLDHRRVGRRRKPKATVEIVLSGIGMVVLSALRHPGTIGAIPGHKAPRLGPGETKWL